MIARSKHPPASLPGRLLTLMAVALVTLMPLASQAEDTPQAPVQVEIFETGKLDIGWVSASETFTVNGEPPTISASNPTVVATASFTLRVTDTRSGGTRTGYGVQVAIDSFSGKSGIDQIPPSAFWIADVSGLPNLESSSSIIGRSLDQPVTVVSTDGSVPINAEITFVVALLLTPETRPTAYIGSLSFSVQPLAP